MLNSSYLIFGTTAAAVSRLIIVCIGYVRVYMCGFHVIQPKANETKTNSSQREKEKGTPTAEADVWLPETGNYQNMCINNA